jgi:1-acyl-sn-glycerol-3-phosphate acyltransferase
LSESTSTLSAGRPATPAEGWRTRWGRRAVSVTATSSALALLVATAPLVLPAAAAVDALRGRRSALARTWAVFGLYLTWQLLGLAVAFAVWVPYVLGGPRAQFLQRNFRLQCWWVRTLFAGASRAFGLHLVVEGLDAVTAGPLLLLVRHASLADTLLPTRVVSSQVGLRLRFVLKRELLWDPCLDVVGQRLMNAFVRRGGLDTPADVAAVRALADDLGPQDGVLLFPEGTRFDPRRQRRALARVEARGDAMELARASALNHVLPPQLGGVLALLEHAPHLDVAFCAHHGLGGARTFANLLNGALVGRTIRVRFWRCPADDLPSGREAQVEWLYREWAKVDAFVAEHGPER